jgi:hypothetical protein
MLPSRQVLGAAANAAAPTGAATAHAGPFQDAGLGGAIQRDADVRLLAALPAARKGAVPRSRVPATAAQSGFRFGEDRGG